MTRRRNTPPEWPDPPDFEGAREVTESLRRELVDIRRDVESIVREEVGKTPADPRRLEMMVRDAVQREVRRQFDERTPWLLTQLHWLAPTAGLLLGLSIGLSAYSALATRRVPTGADSMAVAAQPAGAGSPAVAGTAPQAALPIAAGPPADPAERAAAYDSMLAAAAPELAPLIRRLETATANADVRAAIAAWRAGRLMPTQAERLHAALVQLILRERVAPGLVIDGQILRNPCGGSTCATLLQHWQTAPAGWPAYNAGVATDPAAVLQAERMLVAAALFGAGP